MLSIEVGTLSHSSRVRVTTIWLNSAQMTWWSLFCWQNKHHINMYLLDSSKSSNRSCWTIMQFPKLNQRRNNFSIYRNEKTWWQMIFSLFKMSISAPNCISLIRGAQEQEQSSPMGVFNIDKIFVWSTFKLWQDTEPMKKIGSYTGQQIFMKTSETTKLPFTFRVGQMSTVSE